MVDRSRIEKHVTLLGVLHIVYHVFGFLAGAFVFTLLTFTGRLVGDPYAALILGRIGAAVGAFLIALSVPGIVGGIWLLRRRAWARILTLVVGALGLLDIPLGTALGVYTFWVLMQDDAVEAFRRQAEWPGSGPDLPARHAAGAS